MAGQRTPGPIGTDTGPTVRIDSGTSALMATPAPGGVCAAPENGLHGPAYTLDLHDLGWVDSLHATQAVWTALEQSWDHVARIVRQETDVVIDSIVHLILPILALGIAVLVASFVFSGGLFALGLALLEWLGLGFLAYEIGCALTVVGGYISRGVRRAVNSLFVPPHQRSGEITLAAIDFARAQAELIKAVLMGIVALLLKNSAVTSSRKAGLPELIGNLRKSRLGEGFAGWVESNWQALVGNLKLRPLPQRSASPPRSAEVFTPSQLARRQIDEASPSTSAAAPSPTQATRPPFKPDIPHHLTSYDGFSQSKGVSGTHNRTEFMRAVQQHKLEIVAETSGTTPGVTQIEYRVPALTREGAIATDANGAVMYKNKSFLKTVYDPSVLPDTKMISLGEQAAESGYANAISSQARIYDANAGGIPFRVYLEPQSGTITNYHPQLPLISP